MSGLKRYTQLPQLLHMLSTGTITLLNPTTWDDRNDTHFIASYKKHKKLRSVLVLCLTRSAATYHHWSVFAGNASGVRIEFDEDKFREWTQGIKRARLEDVEYLLLNKASLDRVTTEKLPFIKRHAFRDEGEVRLIVEEPRQNLAFKGIPFTADMIREVVASPWLPPALFPAVRSAIRAANPGAKFKIRATTMLENKWFKSAADNEA